MAKKATKGGSGAAGDDQPEREQDAPEPPEWREGRDRVADEVIKALGKPPGLVAVNVTKVGDYSYRVNVIVKTSERADTLDILNKKIGYSFFVTETTGGIASNPPIVPCR